MNPTVLVIDDSALIRGQVREALTDEGYDVTEAADGEEAVEALQASELPVLIVCDVNMPRMNGLEFLEVLRTSPASKVPVVMLTTEMQRRMVRRARQLGAMGWLLKPFKADLLVAAVHRLTGEAA
jgi:two-component system chemotaxis response regulator CheY